MSNIQSSAYRQAASSRQSQASRSSYREEEEEEEEDLQRNIGAGYHDLSVNNDRYVESQSQRRAQQSQRESETRITSGGRPVTVYVPGGSTVTSSRSSSGSNSESQLTETRTQRPIAVGQYVSMAVRPGTSTVLTIPVAAQDQSQQRVYSSSNRRDYQAGAESSRTRVQPGYQFNYYPSYSSSDRTASSTGSRSDSVTSRTSTYQQPERISSTNTRYNEREVEEEEDEEETQQRISPANTGGSRYTSTSGGSTNYQQGYTSSSRLVPVAPIHTVESTSSQRTAAEEREQRRYSQARPAYSQRTSASRNENEQASSSSSQQTTVNRPVYSASRTANTEGSQYGSSGTTYYTVPASSQSRINLQSQSQQGSSSQSQYQAGSGSQSQYVSGSGSRGGYQSYPTYSRTTGSQSQRGSSAGAVNQRFNSHTMSTGSDNLLDYMSESERLAKAQQSQVIGTQASTSSSAAEANRRTVNTASNLDAAAASFVSSSNLANRFNEFDNVENLGGAGGFKRVKSWQKQSKWASGKYFNPLTHLSAEIMINEL